MATKKHLHEKLGISFAELGALYGVRALLASGVVKMHKGSLYTQLDTGEHVFNMKYTCQQDHCGSVGCIGGNMAVILGKQGNEISDYVYDNMPMKDLFFPKKVRAGSWDKITPKQAVQAIDNFLKYGKPRWETIPGIKTYKS